MAHVRHASKAGSWYVDAPERLRSELDHYLAIAGAAATPPLLAGVAPHAGLAYSGPVAARLFAWLRESNPRTETFLIFGAVHTMPLQRPAIWAEGAWETPLGPLEVDADLSRALIEAGVGEAKETPHEGDNAIELLTPFLAHVFPRARIVPIACPPTAKAHETGALARRVVAKLQAPVVALGSTDLTHYGPRFGFMPAGRGHEAHAWSKENDRSLLALVESLEAERIVPHAEKHRSACGAGALAAVTAYAREANCRRASILEHTTSYEVAPDREADTFIGYAAIAYPAPESRGAGEDPPTDSSTA